MKRRLFKLGLLIFVLEFGGGSIGCKNRMPSYSHENPPPATKLAGEFLAPYDIVMASKGKYFISHLDADGKGVISKIEKKKEEISVVWGELVAPKGMAVDTRRNLLFVSDEGNVKVFSIKKPEKEVRVIPLEEGMELSDLTFSIMNRKAYGPDPRNGSIWEISAKEKSAKVLIEGKRFRDFSRGMPDQVLASVDGKRLYATTRGLTKEGKTTSCLISVPIRKPKGAFETIRCFENIERFSGLEIYRGYFVLLGVSPEGFRILHTRKDESPELVLPPGLTAFPSGSLVDYGKIIFLDHPPESRMGEVVSFQLTMNK